MKCSILTNSFLRLVFATLFVSPMILRIAGSLPNNSGQTAFRIISVCCGCSAIIWAKKCSKSSESVKKIPAGVGMKKGTTSAKTVQTIKANRAAIEAINTAEKAQTIKALRATVKAQSIFKDTTNSILHNRLDIFTPQKMPELFYKYPDLNKVIKTQKELTEFLEANPNFTDDAALSLYRAKPYEFKNSYEKNKDVKLIPDSFGNIVKKGVEAENREKLRSIYYGTLKRLEEIGFDSYSLLEMEEEQAEKLLKEVISKEISHTITPKTEKWGYSSEKIFVNGEIGHFSYKQDIGVFDLIEWNSNTRDMWEPIDFKIKNVCIYDFCLDSKMEQEIESAEK